MFKRQHGNAAIDDLAKEQVLVNLRGPLCASLRIRKAYLLF